MLKRIVGIVALLFAFTIVPIAAQGEVHFQETAAWGGRYLDSAFNGDATRYALATPAGVEIYDLTADDLPLLSDHDLPGSSAISVNGDQLAVVHYALDRLSKQISLIDLASGTLTESGIIADLPLGIDRVQFSPDGASLAALSDGDFQVFDVASGVRKMAVVLEPYGDRIRSIAWSDDSRYVAVNNDGLLVIEPDTASVTLQSGLIQVELTIQFAHDLFVAYNPRFDEFATFNTITGEFRELRVERINSNYYFDLFLSPELDTALVSEGSDTYLTPFPPDGEMLMRTEAFVNSGRWSPGGRYIYRSRSNPNVMRFYTLSEQGETELYAEWEGILINPQWSPGDRFVAGLVSVGEDVYSNYAFRPVVISLEQPELIARPIDRVLSATDFLLPTIYTVASDSVYVLVSCGMLTLDFSTDPVGEDFEIGCGDGGDGPIIVDMSRSADGRLMAWADRAGRVELVDTDPVSPTNGEVLQTLDAGTGETFVYFAGSSVFYVMSEDGIIRRYENN